MQNPTNAGRTEDLQRIAERKVAFAIALALKRQHRIRPNRDAAVDHAGEMDAEKRHRRIGDRVDQMVDDMVVFRRQAEVLATERADDKTWLDAEHFHQPIGHQSGAGN